MKKFLCVLMLVCLILACGCGKKSTNKETSSVAETSSAVESLPESSLPQSLPAAEWVIVNVDKNSFVNVRSGPGKDQKVLGKALLGEKYEIDRDGCTEEWIKINYKGAAGYVYHSYIAASESK